MVLSQMSQDVRQQASGGPYEIPPEEMAQLQAANEPRFVEARRAFSDRSLSSGEALRIVNELCAGGKDIGYEVACDDLYTSYLSIIGRENQDRRDSILSTTESCGDSYGLFSDSVSSSSPCNLGGALYYECDPGYENFNHQCVPINRGGSPQPLTASAPPIVAPTTTPARSVPPTAAPTAPPAVYASPAPLVATPVAPTPVVNPAPTAVAVPTVPTVAPTTVPTTVVVIPSSAGQQSVVAINTGRVNTASNMLVAGDLPVGSAEAVYNQYCSGAGAQNTSVSACRGLSETISNANSEIANITTAPSMSVGTGSLGGATLE